MHDHIKQLGVPTPYIFLLYVYYGKDQCSGVVYLTVLCDHPYMYLFLNFFLLYYPYILLHL